MIEEKLKFPVSGGLYSKVYSKDGESKFLKEFSKQNPQLVKKIKSITPIHELNDDPKTGDYHFEVTTNSSTFNVVLEYLGDDNFSLLEVYYLHTPPMNVPATLFIEKAIMECFDYNADDEPILLSKYQDYDGYMKILSKECVCQNDFYEKGIEHNGSMFKQDKYFLEKGRTYKTLKRDECVLVKGERGSIFSISYEQAKGFFSLDF